MKKKLRLYVWEDVLCDYTCGIMFALAYSVEEAREMIIKEHSYGNEELKEEPKVYDKPVSYKIWGGS